MGDNGRAAMRVAQVCPYSLSRPGGVQHQVLGLARELRRRGHFVRVLAPCDAAVEEPAVVCLGRSIPARSNGSIAPIAAHPASVARTRKALREGRFDVVHVHEPLVPTVSITAVLTSRSPVVGTFHRAGPSLAYSVLGPAARWLASRLSVRCAVSEEAKATAYEALGGHYKLMFNAVDTARFSGVTPWPSNGPTVFFIGRHEPRKGLAVLLDAFPALSERTRLWIAGDGPETRHLRAQARAPGRIEWLGRIGDDEAAARMRGANVVCAPSTGAESFGLVLLEAMAAGTAVVASDLPGYRKVARDEKEALLVPPGDSTALASALRSLLGDPDRADRLAKAGMKRADSFSIGHLVDNYLALYSGLLGS